MHECFFGNIYAADRLIRCIMNRVKFPNVIALRQQSNSPFMLDVLRNIIENVIDNNSSDIYDYDSVPPLYKSNPANVDVEPLVT